ncbi:hypothetical protein [Pseudoruegeria sp. SHC-113]|uniref:hypothetical protein n=1 Tax=Pseudoruegeria sp. SHC-113 TaxID=2855439 RepID=UPI0021BB558F|nr:hypothetical protein [Pseudoruegeria sp. SHC-113]MCT8158970.1 hypothetical protein [Pseudoruegeria sp. SHC-113]
MTGSNAITVCENVCRDFNFLSHIPSGVLASVLASATALYIGLRVYPRQKEEDRKLQIRLERRTDLKKFVVELGRFKSTIDRLRPNSADTYIQTLADLTTRWDALEDALLALTVSSNTEVLEAGYACQETHRQVYELLQRHLERGIQSGFQNNLWQTIRDNEAFDQKVVSAQTEFINIARQQEYGLSAVSLAPARKMRKAEEK